MAVEPLRDRIHEFFHVGPCLGTEERPCLLRPVCDALTKVVAEYLDARAEQDRELGDPIAWSVIEELAEEVRT